MEVGWLPDPPAPSRPLRPAPAWQGSKMEAEDGGRCEWREDLPWDGALPMLRHGRLQLRSDHVSSSLPSSPARSLARSPSSSSSSSASSRHLPPPVRRLSRPSPPKALRRSFLWFRQPPPTGAPIRSSPPSRSSFPFVLLSLYPSASLCLFSLLLSSGSPPRCDGCAPASAAPDRAAACVRACV